MNTRTLNNWDDLRFLVALHRTGTMASAARYLGTNAATVSRRIERLSETLGAPALVKTPKGWVPSPSARRLIDVAMGFEGRVQSELNSAADGLGDLIPIKLGCVPIVNSLLLVPSLREQPGLLSDFALTFNDRLTPGSLGENDLVVGFVRPDSSRLEARKVGSLNFRIYLPRGATASKGWLGLSDLYNKHDIMRFADAHFKTPPRHRTGTFDALYDLMKALRMPGPLPEAMGQSDPDLVAIETAGEPLSIDCWVFFHETRREDVAICRMVEWIEDSFARLG